MCHKIFKNLSRGEIKMLKVINLEARDEPYRLDPIEEPTVIISRAKNPCLNMTTLIILLRVWCP